MESAKRERAYLRAPSLRGDTIAFVSDDDLWLTNTAGGIARRVTAGLSEPSTPCLSPDGRWIAFVSRDEQHAEVYVMPAEGGPARRLTWLGPDTMVRGWTPQGQILFVTTYGQPFFRNYRAYTVAPEGGTPQLLPHGQVNHLSYGPGERKVIGRNTADPARWKRYRGGTAGHLWVDAAGDGQFKRLTALKGNITSPMWIGSRIYHLSDFEGVANLYSCRPDGSDLQRHTEHEDYYARHAQSDGNRIVYQCGAEVWLYDPASDQTQRIEIDTPSHRTQAARKFVPAADHLGGFQLHPQGHSLAIDARGQLFSFALWEGAVRRHGADTPARVRHGQWLADGTSLIATSDATGEERIVVYSNDATNGERSFDWDVGRVTEVRAAPKGTRVAIANHRNELLVGDVASGEIVRVDASEFGRCEGLAWSDDGGWLAYAVPTSIRHAAIKLHQAGSTTTALVTQPEFRDYSPSFDPSGKYLYFLSLRTFDPVYDSVQFELSFPRAARPYLIALQSGGSPPFEPQPKGLAEGGKDGERDGDNDDSGDSDDERQSNHSRAVRVDLDGIVRRVAPFPVPENRFGRVVGAAGGKVVWSIQSIVGAHGRGGHADGPARLEVFDFASARAEPYAEKADAFELAADGVTLVLREGKKLRAISVHRKPEADKDPAVASGAPSRKSGWIDLERMRVSIAPRAEWRQMFREVWRLQRDNFWTADISGIDWNAAFERYAPLLDRIATRAELSDLIWELQGELGTSHAYEIGGDHRKPPQVALGYLGAETRWNEASGGYEITRIVDGDPWDAGADSPLNSIGVEAKVGESIVAVNGQRLSRELPPQALLVHQANAKVELTLAAAGKTGKAGKAGAARNVLVRTLADEVPAHYREWVERNRAWVHEQSGGRVGYFHLPDMMAAGYAEFHRYFSAECDRDGLIVDVRYNRGGHVSQLLLEKVARKRIGYALTRWGKPTPYPDEAVNGPVIALTNEHAGSDGDIFSHSFKLMDIGTLVGTRTWGGVVGIYPRHALVDGSNTTQPEYAFWFRDVGWGVENYGTDPQIEIDNAPQDAASGHDRQLETALATVLKQIDDRRGETTPNFEPRPMLARPAWPTRG